MPADKRQLFAEFAHVARVLSSGARLELLELLFQSERTVDELAGLTGLSFANVSQHLQIMRLAHMVEVRRDGLFAYYRTADNGLHALWESLRRFGEANVASMQSVLGDFLKSRLGTEAVEADELQRRLANRSVVLLDVRPVEEFSAGHIAGAISVPLSELRTRLTELPRSKHIVAYCRGPYCVQSDDAVALLSKQGFKASRLALGLPEWRSQGLPMAATDTAPRTKKMQRKAVKNRRRVRR